jgi:hypothetical protein
MVIVKLSQDTLSSRSARLECVDASNQYKVGWAVKRGSSIRRKAEKASEHPYIYRLVLMCKIQV